MACDMCGAEKRLVDTVVEGSLMHLCEKCCRFGRSVEIKRPIPSQESHPHRLFLEETRETVLADASSLIRREREKRDMNQQALAHSLGEKQSWIHKIESGQVTLTTAQAKVFERFLDVKLTEQTTDSKAIPLSTQEKNMTIGDRLNLKKRLK